MSRAFKYTFFATFNFLWLSAMALATNHAVTVELALDLDVSRTLTVFWLAIAYVVVVGIGCIFSIHFFYDVVYPIIPNDCSEVVRKYVTWLACSGWHPGMTTGYTTAVALVLLPKVLLWSVDLTLLQIVWNVYFSFSMTMLVVNIGFTYAVAIPWVKKFDQQFTKASK